MLANVTALRTAAATSDRESALRPDPTRGAVAWARQVLELYGLSGASGVVQVGTQREVASAMGISPGTVARHVRRLGPIVVDTVPIHLDVDALEVAVPCGRAPNGTRWVSRGPRSTPPPPGSPSAPPEREAVQSLVVAVAALIDSVTQLIASVSTVDGHTTPHASANSSRDRTRRGATARATLTTKVARAVASVASASQTVSSYESPGQEKDPDWLADSASCDDATARATSTGKVARAVASSSRQDDVAEPELTVEQVNETIAPLVELCRRCHLPDNVDRAGLMALRLVPLDALRYGVNQVSIRARSGRVHTPLGFLVAQARQWAKGEQDFFTPQPAAPPPSAPVAEPCVEEESGEDVADPLVGLTADELAELDASIKGGHNMSDRLRDIMRRNIAREHSTRRGGGT